MPFFGGFSVEETAPLEAQECNTGNLPCAVVFVVCNGEDCIYQFVSVCFQLCRFQKTLCPTSIDRAIVADVEGRGGKVCVHTTPPVYCSVYCGIHYYANTFCR